jgi:hypothetical protein
MKIAIAAGFTVLCVAGVAGVGVGVPSVMAAQRSAPAPGAAPAPAAAQAGPVSEAGWPASKTAAMASENQLRAAAAGKPVVPPAEAGQPGTTGTGTQQQAAAVAPGSAYTAGILPLTDGGPFTSAQFVGDNVWNGPVGGRWEVIQAGGAPTNGALGSASPAKAGLFVYTESADPSATSGRRVTGILAPSPDPAGTFTVTKASGGTLTLTLSGSGATYYFDVATGKFTR